MKTRSSTKNKTASSLQLRKKYEEARLKKAKLRDKRIDRTSKQASTSNNQNELNLDNQNHNPNSDNLINNTANGLVNQTPLRFSINHRLQVQQSTPIVNIRRELFISEQTSFSFSNLFNTNQTQRLSAANRALQIATSNNQQYAQVIQSLDADNPIAAAFHLQQPQQITQSSSHQINQQQSMAQTTSLNKLLELGDAIRLKIPENFVNLKQKVESWEKLMDTLKADDNAKKEIMRLAIEERDLAIVTSQITNDTTYETMKNLLLQETTQADLTFLLSPVKPDPKRAYELIKSRFESTPIISRIEQLKKHLSSKQIEQLKLMAKDDNDVEAYIKMQVQEKQRNKLRNKLRAESDDEESEVDTTNQLYKSLLLLNNEKGGDTLQDQLMQTIAPIIKKKSSEESAIDKILKRLNKEDKHSSEKSSIVELIKSLAVKDEKASEEDTIEKLVKALHKPKSQEEQIKELQKQIETLTKKSSAQVSNIKTPCVYHEKNRHYSYKCTGDSCPHFDQSKFYKPVNNGFIDPMRQSAERKYQEKRKQKGTGPQQQMQPQNQLQQFQQNANQANLQYPMQLQQQQTNQFANPQLQNQMQQYLNPFNQQQLPNQNMLQQQPLPQIVLLNTNPQQPNSINQIKTDPVDDLISKLAKRLQINNMIYRDPEDATNAETPLDTLYEDLLVSQIKLKQITKDDFEVNYSNNFGYLPVIPFQNDVHRMNDKFKEDDIFKSKEPEINNKEFNKNNRINNITVHNNQSLLYIKDDVTKLKYLIDSGAQKSVVPLKAINSRNLVQTGTKLLTPNNAEIKVYGTTKIKISIDGKEYNLDTIVADVNTPILGTNFLHDNQIVIDHHDNSITSKLDNIKHYCVNNINTNIETPLSNEIINLLERFNCLFDDSQLESTNESKIKHAIKLNINTPVYSKPYYLAQEFNIKVKEQFLEFLKNGIVRRSKSPFASPITIVKKSNGDIRICGDYRKLNKYTINDCYPLPHIHTITENLHKSKVFSKLDLRQAFYQIPMEEDDIEKTAVVTNVGLFEFVKMPFGLKTASQTFQRQMDNWFRDLNYTFSYIDDLIVHSRSLKEHLIHLEQVFELLKKNGIKINKDKSQFARPSVSYLSYKISENGIKPSEDRLELIRNQRPPRTIGELRKIIGIFNYFSRFISNYSVIVKPLTSIKSLSAIQYKDRSDKKKLISTEIIILNKDQLNAFEKLKSNMLNSIELKFPIPNTRKLIEVDASASGYGAVLYQMNGNDKELISLTSGIFDTKQATKDTYSCELEGAYQAIRKFSKIVEASPTTLYTDNKTLISRFKSSNSTLKNYELRRLNYISQYIDDMIHIPGQQNILADYLSRNAETNRISNLFLGHQLDLIKLSRAQTADPMKSELLRDKQFSYKLIGNGNLVVPIIYKENLIYVPDTFVNELIHVHHANIHQSARLLIKQIKPKFWFKKLSKRIKEFTRSCAHCQLTKTSRYNQMPATQIQIEKRRFNTIHVDMVGPLLMTDNFNQYMLTIIDHFTKFLIIVPVKSQDTETTIEALMNNYIKYFGIPAIIISDNGSNFTSTEFNNFISKLKIKHLTTTSNHPQTNGLLERQHRKIKDSIRCLANTELQWDVLVPMIQLTWNNCPLHNSINSPSQLTFGQEMCLPHQLFERKELNELKEADSSQIEQFIKYMYDLNPHPTDHKSKITKPFQLKGMNDCKAVYVKNFSRKNKLCSTYKGPLQIINRYDKYLEIMDAGQIKKVSMNDVKPAFELNLNDLSEPFIVRSTPIEQQTRTLMKQRQMKSIERNIQSNSIQKRLDEMKNRQERAPIDVKKIISEPRAMILLPGFERRDDIILDKRPDTLRIYKNGKVLTIEQYKSIEPRLRKI